MWPIVAENQKLSLIPRVPLSTLAPASDGVVEWDGSGVKCERQIDLGVENGWERTSDVNWLNLGVTAEWHASELIALRAKLGESGH